MQQNKCPKCGWASRISYLVRTQEFKCEHCGHRWKKEEVSSGK